MLTRLRAFAANDKPADRGPVYVNGSGKPAVSSGSRIECFATEWREVE